jgi:hypothetical protein
MQDLILEGFSTPELEATLALHPALPIAKELAHLYKLYVTSVTDADYLVMSYSNGMNVCSVGVDPYNNKDKSGTEPHYCVYTPYYAKTRGRSSRDKSTVHSKNLRMLMTVLKKNNVIPTVEQAHKQQCLYTVNNNVSRAERYAIGGDTRKGNELNPQAIHELLKYVFDEGGVNELDKRIYKTVFDKYNEADRITEQTKAEMSRMFDTAFYILGVNRLEEIVVGVAKRVDPMSEHGYEMIKPLKRVENLDEYSELLAVMTMFKVSRESENGTMLAGLLPVTCKYIKDLEISLDYNGYPNEFEYVWAVTPCTANFSEV